MDITDTTDTPGHMDTTMERDLPMLSQRLRLMLIPICCTVDTMDIPMLLILMDITDTHTHMDTMERDLLMLSQSQRLMLMLGMDTMDMD